MLALDPSVGENRHTETFQSPSGTFSVNPEKMCLASAIGTSETLHRRYPAVALKEIGQTAFCDAVALVLVSGHVTAHHRQKINVPALLLFVREMPRYPLVETVHRTAHVAVCPGLQTDAAEGTDLRFDLMIETEEEDIGPFLIISSFCPRPRPLSES